jgi:hypothetical protein
MDQVQIQIVKSKIGQCLFKSGNGFLITALCVPDLACDKQFFPFDPGFFKFPGLRRLHSRSMPPYQYAGIRP